MRALIAPLVALATLAATVPAQAAIAPAALAARLEAAREAYLPHVPRSSLDAAWEARYKTGGWFQPAPEPTLAAYEALVREVGDRARQTDQGDRTIPRKALWVRPYQSDATRMRALEVFDKAQALGVTEIYLETFYGGRTIYPTSRAFPARWPGLDVAKIYAREARHRNIKLYAWVHTLRWGDDQVRAGFAEGVTDGKGRACSEVAGTQSAFVSPSNAAVRTRLDMLFDEIANLNCFEGVWLDYLRYPLAAESVGKAPDPRDFWGYGPSARQAFAAKRPEMAQDPYFMEFLKTGEAPDPITREEWITAWRGFLASELREVLASARARLHGRTKTCMVFHPGVYLKRHDARAQDALAWLSYYDEAAAMCYAYDPALDPGDMSLTRATIDRELDVVESAMQAFGGRKPNFLAALAAEPPERAEGPGPRHWPVQAQVAYLKGRRVEGAFPSLEGVALFSYGWLWPQSEAGRRAAEPGVPASGRPGPL